MGCRIKNLTKEEAVLSLKFIRSIEFDYIYNWSKATGEDRLSEVRSALLSLEEYLKYIKDEYVRREEIEQRGGRYYGRFNEWE